MPEILATQGGRDQENRSLKPEQDPISKKKKKKSQKRTGRTAHVVE
jgi:hypothetical protein